MFSTRSILAVRSILPVRGRGSRRPWWLAATAVPLLAVLSGPGATPAAATALRTHHRSRAVCSRPLRHFARCNAFALVDGFGHPLISAVPTGLGPADLQGAYGLPATGGAGRTVAVVDAYDDPHADADLATYRAHYGLPATTVTKLGQNGTTTLPAPNSGWAEEITLDLDAVSAVCPGCSIVLVEATSSSITDLLAAEQTATHLPGVVSVSNSWGGGEPSNVTALDAVFAVPGVLVTASAGDDGYGVEFPAAAPSVVAVGGTALTVGPGHTYGGETAWSGGGSGCASIAVKPAWQTTSACAHRAVADASAVADPNTGLAVYDSYGQRASGWLVVGGTSLSAPVIAAVHALAGSSHNGAAALYAPGLAAHDVTAGSNGRCTHRVLCRSGVGWDGPTGVGSPAGLAGW